MLQAVLCAAVALALCTGGIGASPAARGAGCRKHVRRVTEYGAVGDGKTLNTAAFARFVLFLDFRLLLCFFFLTEQVS